MNAGWYPDPVDENARRYWDGTSWSAPLPLDETHEPGRATGVDALPEQQLPNGPVGPDVAETSHPAGRSKVQTWVSTHRLISGLAVAAVIALSITTYALVSSGPTMTIQGDVSFGSDLVYPDSIGSGPDASGDIVCNGAYDSGLIGGDPVHVKVGGDTVATGTLDEGTWDADSTTCTMTFTIRGVPANEDDYDVIVGDSLPVNFTKQEMVDGPSICRGSEC